MKSILVETEKDTPFPEPLIQKELRNILHVKEKVFERYNKNATSLNPKKCAFMLT